MKTNLRILLSFLIFGWIGINSIDAQSTAAIPSAHSTTDGVITFDANAPLSGFYSFDFSAFNYSEEEAKNVAKNLEETTTALSTQLDYSNQKIIIMIDQTDPAVTDWDVKAWNDHLIEVQKVD